MDLSTILVGTVVILVSVLPLVILNRTRKNKEKKKLLVLSALAKQRNAIITDYEVGENWSIGIDDQNMLLFVQNEQVETYDLKEMQRCKTSFSNRSIKQSQSSVIEEVMLVLEPVDKQKSVQIIHLYNADRDEHALADELRASEKWQKIIMQRINETKSKKHSSKNVTFA